MMKFTCVYVHAIDMQIVSNSIIIESIFVELRRNIVNINKLDAFKIIPFVQLHYYVCVLNANSERNVSFQRPTGFGFSLDAINVSDPIYRHLIDDGEEDERIWCVVSYSKKLEFFVWIMNIFHFLTPFAINLFVAFYIIHQMARQRSTVRKKSNVSTTI